MNMGAILSLVNGGVTPEKIGGLAEKHMPNFWLAQKILTESAVMAATASDVTSTCVHLIAHAAKSGRDLDDKEMSIILEKMNEAYDAGENVAALIGRE
jgi:hypothetical protein